jgi:molecular chaperone DnaJ
MDEEVAMPGTDAIDLYAVLDVAPTASDDEIKRAYRRKARELHPDANGGDAQAEARFKEVTLAYEVLRDPERRARYDRFGPEGVFGRTGAGPGGFDFESGLGDLFEAFFGSMAGTSARGQRGGPTAGPDAEVTLRLEFAEAVFGAQKEIVTRLPVRCPTCEGSGARPGTQPVRCVECDGTGEVRRIRQSLLGQVVTASVCARCQGMGEMIPTPCPDCRGEGRRMEEQSLLVDVPAGVAHGSTLRLAGKGPAGPRGGANGSLFVHLAVTPDDRFERVDDDLHTTVRVAVTQAALGAEVPVETLEQPRNVTLAPGTQSGHVIRIKAAGVPHLRGRGRGDLFVHVHVTTPTGLTARQEQLLRELAAERDEPTAPGGEGVLSRLRSAFS